MCVCVCVWVRIVTHSIVVMGGGGEGREGEGREIREREGREKGRDRGGYVCVKHSIAVLEGVLEGGGEGTEGESEGRGREV